MSSIRSWCLLAASAMSPLAVHAGEYRLSCPPVLDTQAIPFNPSSVPAGWAAYMPSALEVQTGSIMLGAPATMRSAKPASSTDASRQDTTTWQLGELPHAEKWLRCGYGAADELTLSRPLPSNVTTCTVTATKDNRGNITGVAVQCVTADK
jgi:hypothetical protein